MILPNINTITMEIIMKIIFIIRIIIGIFCYGWFWYSVYHFNERTDKEKKCTLKDFTIEIPVIWFVFIIQRVMIKIN